MKYEVLKTALKKMECHRSTSSRNHINACSTKTYQILTIINDNPPIIIGKNKYL